MKRLLIFQLILLLVVSLAADLMIPTEQKAAVRNNVKATTKYHDQNVTREAPTYEFVNDPTDLVTNYYDYMPGSYNSTPVRVQPGPNGGVYMIFHARETSDATRRVYYAYVDAAGNVTATGTIGTEDIKEGYAGIDIDWETGDPFVSWHTDSDPSSADLECVATYDLAHISPGLWITPFEVITDDLPSPNGSSDEFEWPYIHIGPSPEAGKRRVYLQANNGYSATDPTENPMIAYADFNIDDLQSQSTLDWEYFTIPLFDNWNQSIPEWIRPFHSFDVSQTDGRLAFFGYNVSETGSDSIYVCYNDNYGQGDWTYHSEAVRIDQWNPQNLDDTYVFTDDDGNPRNLYWSFIFGGHMQSVFVDNNKMVMSIPFGLQYDDDAGDNFYYKYLIFPYIFQYDFTHDQFHHRIQAPEVNENAVNPNYNWAFDEVYCPWDTDNDGEVDEYDDEGNVLMYNGWPVYFWNDDVAFHENNMKIAVNEENGWIVNMWQNGLYSKYYNDLGDDDYIDWANIAEICFTVSKNGGDTWSEPIIMNSKSDDINFVDQFDGMLPAYVYLSDKIEDLGNGWGEVHLMFLDDNSFGSFIQGYGEDLGGTMEYASIKIDFNSVPASANDPVVPAQAQLMQNYPNPFNPTTTIAYNVKEAADIKIEIFNMKGQKVTTLVNEHKDAGIHSVTWNGKDSNNKNAASGIYFYKMQTDDEYNSTKKMLLMK